MAQRGHSAQPAGHRAGLGAGQQQRPPPARAQPRPCRRSDPAPPAGLRPEQPAQGGWAKRESSARPSFVSFLWCWVWGFGSFFSIQPLRGPTRGLLPPPTSLLVAVTRQTFLVVTAGLVELARVREWFLKKE